MIVIETVDLPISVEVMAMEDVHAAVRGVVKIAALDVVRTIDRQSPQYTHSLDTP